MLFWSFMAIFSFCLLGEVVINEFDMFNKALCNTNWYFFPIEMQQMLMIFMTFVQQSATIRGTGKTVCRLEVFKEVIVNSKLFRIEK